MSLEKIASTIEANGIEGIKKAELKRKFQEVAEIDSILQELVSSREIFIEKKGNSYYCWHKNYYLQKLLNTDQKFSLMYAAMNAMEDSLNSRFNSINATLDTVTKQVMEIIEEIRDLTSSEQREIGTNDPSTQKQFKPTKIN